MGQVTRMLEQLARGEVDAVKFVSIIDVSAMRAEIEAEAEAIGLEIVIRARLADDSLMVLRFADYAEVWGLP